MSFCVAASLMMLIHNPLAHEATSPPSPQNTARQDLFFQGMNGVPVYRIPALVVTRNAVVVAVCDARMGEGQDLPNDIDLVMRRSLDSGQTWSEPKVISDFGQEGGGDAALLFDRETGRLWCLFTYAPAGVGVRTSQPGVSGNTFQLHLMWSDDDGATWSAPRNLNADVKPPEWDAVWSSPGLGYQDRAGRLYFPLSRKSGDTLYSHFIYSDDHGASWRMGGMAGKDTNEWTLIERGNGHLLANMRGTLGTGLRAIAASSDRGQTWSGFRYDDELVEPECQACLMWYDHAGTRYLLFSNPADKERRRMTIKVSRDEGESWPIEYVVDEGYAAYSCMAVLPDGHIGILYECGDKDAYERITFQRIPLSRLMATPGE